MFTKKMKLSEQNKQAIKEFVLWLCDKYEVFEPEEDGYTLYNDMIYHSKDEILKEYFDESNERETELQQKNIQDYESR